MDSCLHYKKFKKHVLFSCVISGDCSKDVLIIWFSTKSYQTKVKSETCTHSYTWTFSLFILDSKSYYNAHQSTWALPPRIEGVPAFIYQQERSRTGKRKSKPFYLIRSRTYDSLHAYGKLFYNDTELFVINHNYCICMMGRFRLHARIFVGFRPLLI